MRAVSEDVARSLFPNLLDVVERGESVTIMRHGVPVAVLTPSEEIRKERLARKIEEWKQIRKDITLGPDLTIRQLIDEGRKY